MKLDPSRFRSRQIPWLVPAVMVVTILAFGVRATIEGRAELARAETAMARGEQEAAVLHARRGAAAYVPFAGHVAASNEILARVAAESEARGDYATSLFAWRSMRAASVSSRSLLTGTSPWRTRAEAAISRLVLAGAAPSGAAGMGLEWLRSEPPPRTALLLLRITAAIVVVLSGYRLIHGAIRPGFGGFWRHVARLATPFAVAVLGWWVGFLA